MADVTFIDGIRVYKPRDNAPEFVKANCAIKANELLDFLDKHVGSDGILRFDILEGRSGNYYTKLNTFKPKSNNQSSGQDEESPF